MLLFLFFSQQGCWCYLTTHSPSVTPQVCTFCLWAPSVNKKTRFLVQNLFGLPWTTVDPSELAKTSIKPAPTQCLSVFLSISFGLSAGLFCDLSVDGIGTCWPRSAAGELISRPCPEKFNGIHYNTTSKYLSVSCVIWCFLLAVAA